MSGSIKFGNGLKVLVVDSSQDSAAILCGQLEALGFMVESCGTLAQAISRWSEAPSDLLFTDLTLSDGSGLSFVQWVLAASEDCSIVLTTADPTVNALIEALRLNVSDFIQKPYDNLGTLTERLRRICETLTLQRREKLLMADLTAKNQQLKQLTAELQVKNSQLEALATKDILTGLNNHDYFQKRLHEELARSQQNGNELSLVLVNLDNFREYNDRLGHQAGNRLLQQVAQLFSQEQLLNNVGGQALIAARTGSDNFALILPESNKLNALSMADSLRRLFGQMMAREFPKENQSISIGISEFPCDAKDVKNLVITAEEALAIAKNNGKNQTISFEKSLAANGRNVRAKGHYLKQLQALERSIKERSFNMLYQPIVDSKTLAVYGYEALVRPTDADITNTYELFTTAMSSGMMYQLGQVLRQISLEHLKAGLKMPQKMFVNLHPQEFSPALFTHLMEEFGDYSGQIVFEVTESEAIKDFIKLNRSLSPLRDAGFLIALDDLGSGYSSLNTLIELKPDLVKLDMELLQHLEDNSSRARLIRHILDYAAGEKMLVVAEGIETDQQRQIVTDMGCPLLQGYLTGRPAAPSWIK